MDKSIVAPFLSIKLTYVSLGLRLTFHVILGRTALRLGEDRVVTHSTEYV